jgi:peptidoglycan/xylan/chitin deacetylase (PgdA/CDA1 family)
VPDVLVLCYHAVSREWPVGLAIRPETLRRQVRWLLDRGYRPATFHDAVVSPPAAKTFSVTFDDGFRNVLTEGYPVLSELGVTATVFPSTAFVDSQDEPRVGAKLHEWIGGPFERELFGMTWDELRTLVEAGWEIGGHSVTHPYLTQLDDEKLDWELAAARERLEQELGVPCRTMAYPTGDHDERVIAAAGRAGYTAACTLPSRFPAAPRPLAWPRVSIQRDDGFLKFRLKVSPALRRLRTTAAWSAVHRARWALRRNAPSLREG